MTDEVVELPAPAPTAAATAAQLGYAVGAIANSLVCSVDGEPLLVLTSGAHRVQEVGGVAPVGHPRPVRTLVDAALEEHPHLWAGAGMPHTVFRSTFTELVKLTGGEAAVVADD
jgi:prolyl-tRNA editing enzyme YbaK/EbsC (Cys-tRNA(Pro) deacylase)